ncbi:MAG: hypothetical protein ACKPFA_18845 [Dolichospermum sp.]
MIIKFINKARLILQKLDKINFEQQQIKLILHKLQESIGRIENRQIDGFTKNSIFDNEFRAFSQWGEDGIIQFLIRNINIGRKIFVEFGVENYTESNTRFLLVNNNWSGLVMDGSLENINYIKQDPIYWRYNLKAVRAFIDKDNINNLLLENGIKGEIGILSIDIDGNDYWIWEAIEVVSPAIVIIEYNSRFGKDKAVTIPYNPSFIRSEAHYSMLYAGASLKAVYNLGKAKGYSFVGSNSVGNNAFFVRSDLKPSNIRELTLEEGYVASQFRESRDQEGNLSYLSWDETNKILFSLPLVDLESNKI